ncbi:MAG: AAA family ATPase [Actinobacteria bacterium]|nr:AAA family ATPase [Actinomycetota bacterium]
MMFADLGGSTGFGERNDPETAREVMARYHALMLAAVEQHGGVVAKFIGDGVMAVWGVPEIAEDDAARAIAAGALMQEAFVGFADDLAGRLGEQLTLRIGINTGEVVIAAGDSDMVGDALNVAARLEKACDPGRVVVGEETWRLTRGALAYEPLGEVTVAGRAEPVAIFRLAGSTSLIEEASTPFVGRDPELARLRAVFDAAVATRSARFATVLGAPGLGKTRLARQFIASLGADAQSLEMRCDRAGEATFAPIVDLLRTAADLGDGVDPDASRSAVGVVLQRAGVDRDLERATDAVSSLLGTGPTRSVEESFWAVRRLVEALANDRPVVLVIDDIQWAEPLLLDLLDHLTEWVTGAPLLLVALARPELRASRPAMTETGRGVAAVVALDGLDSGATAQLAGLLLGTDQLPVEIIERLPASTDGNPLFVRELVRMLVDDRIIERHGDEWRLAIDADAIEVPPTIQSLLAARVERLPADERAVLERASIIGSEFNLGALRHLVEPADQQALPGLLERLRRKELVEPTGAWWGNEPVHRFHHVLIRDATYRRQLKATRAELHERVGRWTDDMSAGVIGEHEAAIAYHFEQAHNLRQQLGPLDDRGRALGRRAAELLTTAARRALDREDLSAAGGLAVRAVALCSSDDGVAVPALLIGCEAVLASGDARTATPLVDDLATRSAGDARLGAWADSFRAEMLVLTDPDQLAVAEGLATEAAAVLHEIGDLAGAGKAHVVRSMVLARLGRVGESEHDLDAALLAARAVDNHRRVTAVLGAAPAAALWGPSPLARVGGRCVDVVRLLRMTTPSPSVEAASMRTRPCSRPWWATSTSPARSWPDLAGPSRTSVCSTGSSKPTCTPALSR